jgi:hypothetical protein
MLPSDGDIPASSSINRSVVTPPAPSLKFRSSTVEVPCCLVMVMFLQAAA